MLLGSTAGEATSTLQDRLVKLRLVCIIRYQDRPVPEGSVQGVCPGSGGPSSPVWRSPAWLFPSVHRNQYVGWGMIAFDSLASYETYQKRLRMDPDALRNFDIYPAKKFVLREERNFVEIVDGTFERPATG